MSVINGYCTLADLQAFIPNSTNASTTMLEQSIEAASRAIEGATGKLFYPQIKTNSYDLPNGYFRRELCLKDDLLALLTFTNGDDTTLAATEFDLWPYNWYPKSSLIMKDTSDYSFEAASSGDTHNILEVLGIWGYHQNYAVAWTTGSTLNGAISSTSATSVTVTSGTLFVAGQIIRVDNELMRVTVVVTNTLTVDRGWNGSTAATHLTLATVTIWRAQADIIRATLIQSARYYRRDTTTFGTVGGGEMGVQAVTIPALDPDVMTIIDPYISGRL
jgi:hypothetical protein